MLRIIRFDGTSMQSSDDAALSRPPDEGEMRWIDLQQYQEQELRAVLQAFGFHPLTIEDCLHGRQRAKLEEFEKYLFIVAHHISAANGIHAVRTSEIDAFLGERYLVTVHRDAIPEIDAVMKRVDSEACRRGMDFIYYLLLDELVDNVFPIIDRISDHIEDVEGEILRRMQPAHLQQLMRIKRVLISIRRVLAPERDAIAMLLRRGDRRVQDRTALYFRDVYDHVVRAYEQIDVERDLLGNTMDAYISMTANRSNLIMKQLTLLASIFLPLSFMTGFFGQNFSALPFDSRSLFYIELGACITLPLGMIYWFRRSGWL
jgi:magnesium transporter